MRKIPNTIFVDLSCADSLYAVVGPRCLSREGGKNHHSDSLKCIQDHLELANQNLEDVVSFLNLMSLNLGAVILCRI